MVGNVALRNLTNKRNIGWPAGVAEEKAFAGIKNIARQVPSSEAEIVWIRKTLGAWNPTKNVRIFRNHRHDRGDLIVSSVEWVCQQVVLSQEVLGNVTDGVDGVNRGLRQGDSKTCRKDSGSQQNCFCSHLFCCLLFCVWHEFRNVRPGSQTFFIFFLNASQWPKIGLFKAPPDATRKSGPAGRLVTTTLRDCSNRWAARATAVGTFS